MASSNETKAVNTKEPKTKNVKKKRTGITILKIILGVILAAAAILCIMIGINMGRNVRSMNSAIDASLDKIRDYAEVTEVDSGEYQNLRIYGIMNFDIHQYEVKDIGNLSTMTMNCGLMQMSTIILTPLEKDIPLISTDYMYIFGNRTSYLECYDLVLDKKEAYEAFLDRLREIRSSLSDLDTITPSSAWYDSMRTEGVYMKGKPGDDARMEEALVEWIGAAMDYAESKNVLTPEERQEKLSLVKTYTDGLIDQGGVSTDIFVKALGEEKTRAFFNTVLFGTDRKE